MTDLKAIKDPPRLLASDPDKIPELESQIAGYRADAEAALARFRDALPAFAGAWMREAAKAVAVAQDEHTVTLGREGIRRLKESIKVHARALPGPVAEQLAPEAYLDTGDASSGQVRRLIGRRFDQGIRRVLATVYPLLEEHGFQRDGHWMDPDPEARAAYPVSLDLGADLQGHLASIIEALTQIKVCESKIVYYKRQRGRDIASELWDSV